MNIMKYWNTTYAKSINPFCLFLSLLITTTNSHGNCVDTIPSTTPTNAFVIHKDGTVTHNKTNLMWMRCPLNFEWNGSTCIDRIDDRYTWQKALNAAENSLFAGYSDWRLPNINELASIVERACYRPSINEVIFPNTSISLFFWSSTTYIPPTESSDTTGYARYQDFDVGYTYVQFKTYRYEVRLVRGGS